MFKTKDVMNPKVICVRPEMPIYEAIRLLVRSNLSSLPVVDEDLKPVGIISEKDVLRLLYDTRDHPLLRVQDFMKTDVISFDIEANLIDFCDCLLAHPFRRIPITHQGMLVGIICRADIIEEILKLKHQQNESKKAS